MLFVACFDRIFLLLDNEYCLWENSCFYYELENNETTHGLWLWKSKRKMTWDYIGFFRSNET
jgi:hypothetical protein